MLKEELLDITLSPLNLMIDNSNNSDVDYRKKACRTQTLLDPGPARVIHCSKYIFSWSIEVDCY